MKLTSQLALGAAGLSALLALPAAAQDSDQPAQGKRYRAGAGAQVGPQYPGADGVSIFPYLQLQRAKAGEDFAFSNAEDSFGIPLINSDSFAFGPVAALQGRRARKDTDGFLPKVKLTVELGGFAQLQGENFRLRGELRQGVNGHKALVGNLSADYIARDGDNWLFAFGPRMQWASGKYNRAYFGIDPANAVPAAGLPAYRPSSGIMSYGAGVNTQYALTPQWGLVGYAGYDRLNGDARKSPVVREFGDRNQWSGGLALTYTFGG